MAPKHTSNSNRSEHRPKADVDASARKEVPLTTQVDAARVEIDDAGERISTPMSFTNEEPKLSPYLGDGDSSEYNYEDETSGSDFDDNDDYETDYEEEEEEEDAEEDGTGSVEGQTTTVAGVQLQGDGSSSSRFLQKPSSGTGDLKTKTQRSSIQRKWRKLTAWYNIGILGTVISILGFLAALLYEFQPSDVKTRLGSLRWDVIGLLLILVSVPTTHWFVGRRRHRNAFAAFQPFVGGARFVVLQAISWAIYGLFTLGFIWVCYKGAIGLTNFVVSSLGLTGILVQLLTIASIHYFSKKHSPNYQLQRQEGTTKRRRLSSASGRTRTRSASSATTTEGSIMASPPPSSPPEPQPSTLRSKLVGHIGTLLTLLSLAAAVVLESVEINSASHPRATLAGVVGMSSVIIAVPLTHGLGGVSLYPSQYKLYQPFKGGPKFVLLQAFGWALWTVAIIIAIAVASAGIRHAQNFKGLLTAGGCFAVISQVLVLSSLKYFDARVNVARHERKLWARIKSQSPSPNGSQEVTPSLSGEGGAATATAVPSEHFATSGRAEVTLTSERVSSSDAAAHKPPVSSKHERVTAVAVEVESKDAQIVSEGEVTRQEALAPVPEHSQIAKTAGKTGMLPLVETHLLPTVPPVPPLTPLAPHALRDEIQKEIVQTAASQQAETAPPLGFREVLSGARLLFSRERIKDLLTDVFDLIVVGTIFHFPLLASIFVLGPIGLAVYFGPLSPQFLSVIFCQALYYSTYLTDHHITGKLASKTARKPIWLWRSFRRYFHGRIISKASYLDPAKLYQFCFHPHGIYPMTCFWATRSEEFQALHPDIEVDILGASVIMFAPAMRELFLWAGGRDVSRRALLQCYSERRNVMLVPGGQKEMRWVHGQDPNKFTFYTKHQGFVRLALQNGVALVPVLSFGENDILHNVHWPKLQAWTYRRIGVALPMYPHGRWYSPIPNRVKVTVVFGEPIEMPTIPEPTKEQVDMYHRQYYEAVRQLFEATKAEAGYPDAVLELV